jgi:hypothetical protein
MDCIAIAVRLHKKMQGANKSTKEEGIYLVRFLQSNTKKKEKSKTKRKKGACGLVVRSKPGVEAGTTGGGKSAK